MSPHSFLWHYLWLAPHALQAILAIVMVRRRLWREFPMFFAYTVFEVIQGAGLFVLDHHEGISGEQYWRAAWMGLGVSISLRFLVIREIFFHVFRSYPGLTQLSRLVLQWGSVLLLLIAVAVAAYAPGDTSPPILAGINVVGRAVGLVQLGLLVFLFLFASYFGLSWKSFVFGIAAGMGIFASVDLATAALRIAAGPGDGSYVLSLVTMATYHCCVLIWLVYLMVPETAQRTVKELPSENLEEWNAALQRLLTQ